MSDVLRKTALPAALSVLFAASVAGAQPVDPALLATRRDMIQQAMAAQAAGDHARALEIAGRANQIQTSPSLNALIAQEALALGHLATSLGAAQQCTIDAERNANTLDRAQVLSVCRRIVADVAPRVGRVRVLLPADVPEGTLVRINGSTLPRVVWGAAYVVTPGAVRVDVSTPAHDPFTSEVTVSSGAEESVEVTLHARPVPAAAPPPAAPVAVIAPPPPRYRSVTVRRSAGVGPYVVAGAGALGLGLAGLFYGLSRVALAARNTQCDASGCPDTALPDQLRHESMVMATNISIGVGVAAMLGAGAWWVLGRHSEVRTERVAGGQWSVGPWLGQATGLQLGGRF